MHICPKGSCPTRISIGSQNDADSVSFVCVECERLYYSSETKSRSVFWFFKMGSILLVTLVVLYASYPKIMELWKNIEQGTSTRPSEQLPEPTTASLTPPPKSVNNNTEEPPIKVKAFFDHNSVNRILSDFYASGDAQDVDAQISQMHFDLDKYYSTGLVSRNDIQQSAENYYKKVVVKSETKFLNSTLQFMNVEPYFDSEIDSIYTYQYSIDYTYHTKSKSSDLHIELLVKLISIDNDAKIKYIEELKRSVINESPIIEEISDTGIVWYLDNDGDGFGVADQYSSIKSSNYTATKAGDCNDKSFIINPLIIEKCDGVDNNCDGNIDEGCEELSNVKPRSSSKPESKISSKPQSSDSSYSPDTDNDGFYNAVDKCPTREGPDQGCPKVILSGVSETMLGETINLSNETSSYSNDKYNWESSSKVNLTGKNSPEAWVSFDRIGKYVIVGSIENSDDDYYDSANKTIYVRADINQVESWFNDLIEFGNFAGLPDASSKLSDSFKAKTKDAEDSIMALVPNEGIKAVKNKLITSSIGHLIRSLKNPKRSKESKLVDFQLTDLEYNIESGLIEKVHYQL